MTGYLAALMALLMSGLSLADTADQFDRQVCNAMQDLNARRSCLIELSGYDPKICNIYRSPKDISLCNTDQKKYQALTDECRKDLKCYWQRDVEFSVIRTVEFMNKVGSNPFNCRDPHGADKPIPLFWVSPSRGSIAVRFGETGTIWVMKGDGIGLAAGSRYQPKYR